MSVFLADIGAHLEDRLPFEMLLSDLSARFFSITAQSLDGEIVGAQRPIAQVGLGLEFIGSIQAQRFVVTHILILKLVKGELERRL
jgi:hypothetical protein